MKELIKNYFKGYSKRGIINGFSKFIKNNPEVESYLNNLLIENPNWENIKNIVYGICFDEQLKKCKNCGKEMKYSKGIKHDYCSNKCRSNSKEIQEKTKQTCLKKYNCENVFQNKNIKNKIKQTNLEKYNCENPAQSKEIQNKIKQTNLKKYNCENPFQNKNIKNKIKQSCIKKYNVEYYSQSKEHKKILHNKSYDYLIPKFIEQGITPLFSKEEYEGYDKIYKWKCNNCGIEFESRIYPTHYNEECQLLPRCWKCNLRLSGESKAELELLDFIKQYFPNAHKDNELIKPKELDIVIDELKLAIEFNGDYWHSSEHWLENHDNLDEYYNYHLNKVLETNKKGYRLIHIWANNSENIKNKLIDIFQNKEDLNFTEDKLILDRSWYNNIEIPGYELVEELQPEIVNRNGFNVENCGYLVYKRIK